MTGLRTGELTFDASGRAIDEAARTLQGGVSSDFRLGVGPHPLVFERAEGPWLFDVDGNRLLDHYLGMGPLILGHRPPEVVAAVSAQLERGWLFGGQHALEAEAAELVVRAVPSAERVRFGSSGSEVIQAALRVARDATGRLDVVKFEGHYHGWFDNILWSVAPPVDALGPREAPTRVPGSKGMDPDAGARLTILPWNDITVLTERLERRDVAAVIMEAAMCNQGAIEAGEGYLRAVRELCDRTGTVLIFDEVITGFRLSAGGAQQVFGVTPDLTVLAKALASGFQVAALVGRADLMEHIGLGKVVHAGTYNTQALAMAATVATIGTLLQPGAYAGIERQGSRLMRGLGDVLTEAGVPHRIQGWPAVFNVALGTDAPITDYRTSLAADRPMYRRFAVAMLRRGVRVLERGTWFLSTTHDDATTEHALEAAQEAIREALG